MKASDFLRRFHKNHPGVTTHAMARGRTAAGVSSYSLLAAEVPPSDDSITVLDLACGDGFLLEQVRCRVPNATLVGVDVSSDELAVARRRLGAGADLREEPADQMSIGTSQIDVALCHMALMLMTPLEPAISQLRRVLKPGATFSAILPSPTQQEGAFGMFARILTETLAIRSERPIALTDPRSHSEAGLRGLFCAETGFEEPIKIEEFILGLDGTAEEVTSFLQATYWSELTSPNTWTEVLAKFETNLRTQFKADGTIPFSLALWKITCRAGHG